MPTGGVVRRPVAEEMLAAGMARVRRQLRRLGSGRASRPSINPKLALATETLLLRRALRGYRSWLATRSQPPATALPVDTERGRSRCRVPVHFPLVLSARSRRHGRGGR
ncbi:hypothetical protein GCM10022222_15750 [Amycolatopsis ultiminotia]|uniref:Uncharacterized protein n=1 Tax=Amycolatopsis ultiminotia TaxID=543629 RepID=A0ABP6VE98_9PSEU